MTNNDRSNILPTILNRKAELAKNNSPEPKKKSGVSPLKTSALQLSRNNRSSQSPVRYESLKSTDPVMDLRASINIRRSSDDLGTIFDEEFLESLKNPDYMLASYYLLIHCAVEVSDF